MTKIRESKQAVILKTGAQKEVTEHGIKQKRKGSILFQRSEGRGRLVSSSFWHPAVAWHPAVFAPPPHWSVLDNRHTVQKMER